MEQSKKLSLGRKLAFASADLFGGGSFNIVNFLYPAFLAMTVGLSPFLAGLVMLVARFWDALSDPMMGILSDRTRSPLGKRRIYLLFAAPLVLLSFFVMFFPFAFEEVGFRFAAALFGYLLFSTVQTMVMIPYYSLSSEISSDYEQRGQANTVRLCFSIFSSIVCVAVPGIIVSMFDASTGYIVMSLSFGTVFALAVLITALFAKEEIISPPTTKRWSFGEFFKPFRVRVFRQYLALMLVLQIVMVVLSSLFFFYIDFYYMAAATARGESSLIGTLCAALMFGMQIVALPIYMVLMTKKSKAFIYILGGCLWILGGFAMLLVTPSTPFVVIIIFAAFLGLAISGPALAPHAMFGDVADVGQLQFGERIEGSMSGLANFTCKIAQAIGVQIVMLPLQFAGFREQVIGEPTVTSQPQSAQMVLRMLMSFAPLLLIVGIIIALKYKLNYDKQRKIATLIESKTTLSVAEIDALLADGEDQCSS